MTPGLTKAAFRFAAVLLLAFWVFSRPAQAAELIMFETDHCPWCAAWEAEVGVIYGKTDAGEQAPLRRVDMEATRPADLVHIEDIVYSPTFVLLAEGKEVGRILGYPGEDHFWGLLEAMLRKRETKPNS